MSLASPVAVTGAAGRLGRALVEELKSRSLPIFGWSRPAYDLDDPQAPDRLIERDAPQTVIHPAAWTDVDGCTREPETANRRNADAVRALAEACAERGIGMCLVSTNEVFDGARADGLGYTEEDEPNPVNAYGRSKLAGENAALEAYVGHGKEDLLWIVRTAWLYGPPGNDFPTKILAAAGRLEPEQSLRVVTDEIGSPTYTRDLARAIVDLLDRAPAGLYHLAGSGHGSRFEEAAEVMARCRPGTPLEPISLNDFVRPSKPPPWAVLDNTKAASFGVTLRSWRDALADYLAGNC